MNTVTDFMGKDHDRLDAIFQKFRQEKKKDPFSKFKHGLQRHIVWEEEILFSIFEERTGMKDSGPTAVMRMEHRQIKDYLEKIHDCLLKGETNTNSLEEGRSEE